MSGLPAGWATAQLSELTTKVGSGATPKGGEATYKSTGTPLIRSMNVVFFGFKRDGLAHLDDDQAWALKGVEVRAHDVLLNITGASIGRVTMAPPDLDGARVNQHVCIIRPVDALDARFLNAYLSSPAMQSDIGDENYGVTRQALTKQQILDFEIPLAPLPEQKRIADKLDALLARVDACRERLDRVPGILKRFRQSVLAAATSGELTRKWREARGVTWEPLVISIGALGEVVTGSTPTKKQDGNFGGEIPFFKPSELDAGYWVENASEYLSRVGASRARLLPPRSVLVTCIGATIGKTGFSRRAGATNQQINAVVCDESIALPEWLYFWCCSPAGQATIIDNASATTLPILNKSRFSALPVKVPNLDEQAEVVRRVSKLFEMAERLEHRAADAQARLVRTTPSALAKAFRGELVPQDPNDEPAAKLLARLRTQPDSGSTNKPKRGRPRATRAKATGTDAP